jgi:hypothetical protein
MLVAVEPVDILQGLVERAVRVVAELVEIQQVLLVHPILVLAEEVQAVMVQ